MWACTPACAHRVPVAMPGASGPRAQGKLPRGAPLEPAPGGPAKHPKAQTDVPGPGGAAADGRGHFVYLMFLNTFFFFF